jgi:hypothetical protein
MPWTLFHLQLEVVTEHNNWTALEKATHLLVILRGQVVEIPHSVPTCAELREHGRGFPGSFRGTPLAAAYRSELKERTHLSSESLQKFAIAIEQLVHRVHFGLTEHCIKKSAAFAFIVVVKSELLNKQLLTRCSTSDLDRP